MRTLKGGVTGLPAKLDSRAKRRGREARGLLTRKNPKLPRVNAPRVPVVLASRRRTAAAPEPVAALPPPPVEEPVAAPPDLPKAVEVIDTTPIPPPTMLNPASKFVFATFWSGRGKVDPTTERPCANYETDLDEEARDATAKDLAAASKSTAEDIRKRLYDERRGKKTEDVLARFAQMCRNNKCNYIAVEYPVDASQAKASFVTKVLDSLKGKGLAVVYVDPHVRVNKYPAIFDMANVDFMSRNLRGDPRSARDTVCFDPYVFETSRIFYFADTVGARDLLDTWRLSVAQNPTKSCEYILSMAFNVLKYTCALSYVELPIEYMWLSDLLLFREGASNAILENADCIDSGEPALPDHYEHLIDDVVKCDRSGGKFYEYVYFEDKSQRAGFGPFLDFVGTGNNMYEVIPYDSKYGDRQAIADKNIEDARTAEGVPTEFNVAQILSELQKGNDVTIGADERITELKAQPLDFIAYNTSSKKEHPIHPDMMPEFDTSKGMFFSAKNPVVYHLVAMCEKAEDLTTVFNSSFIFVSRIRCYWLR